MWHWLQSNTAAITATTSLISVMIWLIYAQLLYQNYRRQRRPKIIISQVGERSPKSMCLLSNMSQEALYIESVQIVVTAKQGVFCDNVTDFVDQMEDIEGVRPGNGTCQGPLASGDSLTVGTFSHLIERALRHIQQHSQTSTTPRIHSEEIQSITIRIVATYGPEKRPVGAARTFTLDHSHQEGASMAPERVYTAQYNHFYNRRKAARWLRATY